MTRTVAPTSTPTQAPATVTPESTETPTAEPTRPDSSTPTGVPATDTPEPRPEQTLEYPAPVLLEPTDGFMFSGGRTAIWLRWEPVGELGEDDYYAVSLRYQKGGGLAYAGTWYKGTEWRVPETLWQQYDPGHPEYYWDVVVMRQTATREDGGLVGEPVGEVSETWRFVWE